MTLEILKTKEDLRNLIDDYAYLGDEKKIAEQMELFTSDLIYKVYMSGALVADVSGREAMEKDFNLHSSQVKTYFTLNGQHTVKINDETASGVSYSQIKMIREIEGKDVLTDYSVKYEDYYVKLNGKWFIKDRIAHFIIVKSHNLP
ncbi:nuclear transport factor 2 family protein [Chryseobacterium aquaticum]|uniref:Nuclear transport factor 2 family protein n=1 Tax=Chryseobacterium aquaticum TaxID=452084 RepID=A0A848MYK2_9FLAO|nr:MULTISPECIES: nuclear transport factor 2 family protein [Chryseobacterium]NMR33176.1 nuclear transport factor 2 family protein [Chryseobacterium aquaticum]NRQ44892.1 nuclear transport factor 2 family protein [Chryseobacterium sp. C-204]